MQRLVSSEKKCEGGRGMLIESIRAATHEPAIRFKTETTEARQRAVDLAVAEVRKKPNRRDRCSVDT